MMQLPVLIQPLPDGQGYIARLGDPFNLTATAATPGEALAEVNAALRTQLATGAQVAAVVAPVPTTCPPYPGWLPDDDVTRDWLDAVEEYRRECDRADQQRILDEPAEKVAS